MPAAGCEIAELHRTAEKRRRLSEAHTQRSRSKAKECWTPNSRIFWTLNGDPRCINQFVHSHHCRSPHKRKISNNIKEYICEHGETMMVHQLIDAVYRKFHVEISSDQVKYILKCNHIRNKERSRSSCRAGGAGDAVEFLFHNTEREVAMLLIKCKILLCNWPMVHWCGSFVRSQEHKNTTF